MRRGCLGVVIHDGIVKVENNAARLAAHQSQEGLLKTLSLEKEHIVTGKLSEESQELANAPGIKSDRGLYPFGFKIGQILQHAIAACGYFKTLNEEKYFHGLQSLPAKKLYHKGFTNKKVVIG